MKGGAKAVGTAVDTVAPARLINWISSGFKDFSKKVSGDASEFASRIVGYKNRAGEPVLRMRHNAEEALGSVRKAMKETNEDLGNIYTQIDDSKVVEVDTEYIYNKLKSKVVDPISDFAEDELGSSRSKQIQNEVLSKFKRDFFMDDPNGATLKLADGSEVIKKVPRKGSVSLLNRIKNDYFEEVSDIKMSKESAGKLNVSTHVNKAAKELAKTIDDHINKASHKLDVKKVSQDNVEEVSDTVYNLWRSKSEKFKDLLNTSALLDDKLTNSTGKDRIRQVFVDHWGKMSLGAGVAMSMYGASYTDSVLVTGALGAIASMPTINKAAGIGVTRIVNAVKKILIFTLL